MNKDKVLPMRVPFNQLCYWKAAAQRDGDWKRMEPLVAALEWMTKPEGVWSLDREAYLKNVLDAVMAKAEQALAQLSPYREVKE